MILSEPLLLGLEWEHIQCSFPLTVSKSSRVQNQGLWTQRCWLRKEIKSGLFFLKGSWRERTRPDCFFDMDGCVLTLKRERKREGEREKGRKGSARLLSLSLPLLPMSFRYTFLSLSNSVSGAGGCPRVCDACLLYVWVSIALKLGHALKHTWHSHHILSFSLPLSLTQTHTHTHTHGYPTRSTSPNLS